MHRTSGVVLHPFSLPQQDLGQSAYEFVDFLQQARQGLWQVLPLHPTGFGHSPYQTLSAFAGHPLLIDLADLAHEGWLSPAALPPPPTTAFVDYDALAKTRWPLLQAAFDGFRSRAHAHHWEEFREFCEEQADWLTDYALFSALKRRFYGEPWWQWPADVAHRQPDAIRAAREALDELIGVEQFAQFQFFRQWQRLRDYAMAAGVRLIGDAPLFVAHDSADVWANRRWFQLDRQGQPTAIAGVPPDYFSADGQKWGNPLYDWDAMAAGGYRFWVERLRWLFNQCDFVRLDHFRGLAAYWAIPADAASAAAGAWCLGPGDDFFAAITDALADEQGRLPLIAEDLGVITPDVTALRDRWGLPGMAILQFAFVPNEQQRLDSLYLPHLHRRHQVVYTGTHDNDTVRGWWQQQSDAVRHQVRRYCNTDGVAIHGDFIRLALSSVADFALFPAQDLLGLGSDARMNRPGQAGANWQWICPPDALDAALADYLAELTELFGRQPFENGESTVE